MSDRWTVYFCNFNNKVSSIFVDVGMRKTIPDVHRPYLLWIWIYMSNPRPDGLPSDDEFSTLVKLEETLVPMVERACDAVFPGRITTDGRREFYFYATHSERLDETVRMAIAPFGDYQSEIGANLEADWSHYLTVLYPTEEQIRLIGNRDLLDHMRKHGDALSKPRNVCHWAYFDNSADRASFRSVAESLGYRIVGEVEKPAAVRPFEIHMERTQEMSNAKIDDAVLELFRASKAAGGEYDGWECEAITNSLPKTEKPWWKIW